MAKDMFSDLDDESLALLGETPRESSLVGGAHDAANRNEKMLALWQPPVQSADYDIIPDKLELDARNRDMLRNDAYVRGGAVVHQDNIVGSLYALNAKPMEKILGLDGDWATEFQEEVETRFMLWGESLDCWVDAGRRNTFTEMVRLAVGVHTAGGEVLATAEWMRSGMRPYKTAIQFIDTDRLCNPPRNSSLYDDKIRAGVERDKYGAPVAHHFRMAHPSDVQSPNYNRWRRVPTRKPWGRLQVIHIFEQMRPDQTRGVAMMVSALKEMRITKQFRDISLQNAVVNATFAAAIESDLPSADAFATLGGTDDPAGAMGKYAANYLGQIAEYTGGARNLQLDGVKIPHLYPGTKLNLLPAGKGGPLGQEFEQSLLRYIASALGVSYEQLSRDYSKTNYSSARAAMAETWKRMNVVKQQVADRFATHVYRLWLEEAVNRGAITSLPAAARAPGWLYENQRLDALSNCDWIGASRGQIEELKETQAAILRMKAGLTTLEQETSRLGQDWRTVLRQRRREQEMADELGVSLGSDEAAISVDESDSGEPENTEPDEDKE